MVRPAEAHVRKKMAFLEGIERERSDASVYWRGQCLGPWRAIGASWRGARIGLDFRFRDPYRVTTALLVSISPISGGAELILRSHRNGKDETLRVIWKADSPVGLNAPGSLAESARSWIQHEIPGCKVLSVHRRSDRRHSLSNAFLRVHVRDRRQDILVLACAEEEPAETIHAILTQALLWTDCWEPNLTQSEVPMIYLMVPAGIAAAAYHRARFVNPSRARIVVWEYECDAGAHWIVSPARPPGPSREEKDFRWPVLGPFRWSSFLMRALDLAPDLIRRYPRFEDYDTLRIHGLEFARVFGPLRDRLEFGVGSDRKELTEDNFDEFRSLVNAILYFRRPDSPDPRHPLFTLQAERWLESLILEDVARLFPELSAEAVYSQIPVYLGRDSGRVDILAADLQGILVVMELKVTTDPGLPLQALDYWGRVLEHHRLGDFKRRGYFSEIRLKACRPRIYLVSPVFEFHDSTERLLRFLDPGLDVWKIGINQDWRAGVRILHRSCLRCGEL